MRTSFVKVVVSAVLAAAIGLGAIHGADARDRQIEADTGSGAGVAADLPRDEASDTSTRWPLPMLVPSI